MNKALLSLIILAGAAAALPALAQTPKADGVAAIASAPGRAEAMRAVKLSATVTAVDKATRTITLKGADGKEFSTVASEEVRNFDQIKVGSQVVVGYVEALALDLKKGGGAAAPTMSASGVAGAAPAGGQPRAMAGRQVTVTASVTAVNAAKQTVTLKGPQRTVEMRVPDANQFKMIAVGDQIQATYTEALAVSVEPAAKKAK